MADENCFSDVHAHWQFWSLCNACPSVAMIGYLLKPSSGSDNRWNQKNS
jgi:hypothetical protein